MRLLEFRPRTRFHHGENAIAVTRRVLAQSRRNNPARLEVDAQEGRLIIRFPRQTAEIWTPEMEVRMVPTSVGTDILAILGPRSSVWGLFRSALLLITAVGVVGLFLGFVQWTLRQPPYGFYLAVAGLCAGLFIWFLSEEGKRRARDEMDLLKTFMNEALGSDSLPLQNNLGQDMQQGRVA
jgi:hypothetical protein